MVFGAECRNYRVRLSTDGINISVLHGSTQTKLGVAGIRDLCIEDLGEIVRFWHESGDDFLDYLGIDRLRLGSRDDTFERFRRAIPAGDQSQQNLAFAITLDSQFAGYTLLNRYTPEVNYSHWTSRICIYGVPGYRRPSTLIASKRILT